MGCKFVRIPAGRRSRRGGDPVATAGAPAIGRPANRANVGIQLVFMGMDEVGQGNVRLSGDPSSAAGSA